jgi:hypothetical protein
MSDCGTESNLFALYQMNNQQIIYFLHFQFQESNRYDEQNLLHQHSVMTEVVTTVVFGYCKEHKEIPLTTLHFNCLIFIGLLIFLSCISKIL